MDVSVEAPQIAYQPKETARTRKEIMQLLDERAEAQAIYHNKPYTFVCEKAYFGGKAYVGFGFSKVSYPDIYDEDTGYYIARRRALYMILREIRKTQSVEDLLAIQW